jgi:hypothetical protein
MAALRKFSLAFGLKAITIGTMSVRFGMEGNRRCTCGTQHVQNKYKQKHDGAKL